MIPSSPLLPSTPAPVRGRGAVRAFGASLLILSEKQRFVRGLDYLAVQHISVGRLSDCRTVGLSDLCRTSVGLVSELSDSV